MPRTYIQSSQKIIPQGEIEISQQSGKWVASQAGYIGGRKIKLEVVVGPEKISLRKAKAIMKKALLEASFVAQEADFKNEKISTLDLSTDGIVTQHFSNQEPIKQNLKEWNNRDLPKPLGQDILEIHLIFEEKISFSPPKNAPASKMKRLLKKIAHFLTPYRFTKTPSLLGLTAEHTAKGTPPLQPAKVIQKLIESETLNLQLRPGAPKNFFDAHEKYTNHPINWIQKLLNLTPGECYILNVSNIDHTMIGMAEMQPNGLLTYYHINTGEGIDHHPSKTEKEQKIYQHFIIRDIHPMLLYDTVVKKSALMALSPNAIDSFYEELLKLGKSEAIDSPHLWTSTQSGEACAATAEKALLKMVLDDESYRELERHLELNSVFKLFKHLQQGGRHSYPIKVGILEIVQKLKRKELNSELKEALDHIETQTRQRKVKTKHPKLDPSTKKEIFKVYGEITDPIGKQEDILKKALFYVAHDRFSEAHDLLALFDQLPKNGIAKENLKLLFSYAIFYSSTQNKSRECINFFNQVIPRLGQIIPPDDDPDLQQLPENILEDAKSTFQAFKDTVGNDYLNTKTYKYYSTPGK